MSYKKPSGDDREHPAVASLRSRKELYLAQLGVMKSALTAKERFQAYLVVMKMAKDNAETFKSQSIFPYNTTREGHAAVTEEEFYVWDEHRRVEEEQREASAVARAEEEAQRRTEWDRAQAEGRLTELLRVQSEEEGIQQFPIDVLRAADAERKKKAPPPKPKTLGQNLGSAVDSIINWFKR